MADKRTACERYTETTKPVTLIQATDGADGNADDGCQIDMTDDLHQTSKDENSD